MVKPDPASFEPVAVIDIGASAVRLVIAEVRPGVGPVVVEEASRAVLLGKDTFSSGGKIGPQTLEATLRALQGFRRMMDDHGVRRYRAVATSAVREAANADTFIDRVQVRAGLQVEVIDGSEESRLTYLAVQESMAGHPALGSHTLLVEAGAGSADITLLEGQQPKYSGVYALGSIRMRQGLGPWKTDHDQRMRVLARHIGNIIGEIRRDMPLSEAQYMIALGQDARFAAQQLAEAPDHALRAVPRDAFLAFCSRMERFDEEELVDRYGLSLVDAETLVPALMVYRELLESTAATELLVPDASLRVGLLVDLTGAAADLSDLRKQVLASAESLGEKYRYDAAHGRAVARLAVRIFDDLQAEHSLGRRDRLLLEVAALLHDIGVYVGLRAHHKHTQYLLASSEVFGLSADDRAIIGNIARYHRRALPQRSHLPYMALDRPERVRVNKLAAILRIANALDAEHLQRVADIRVLDEPDGFVLDLAGEGDLSMERMAVGARSDLFVDVFGRKLAVRTRGA
jgi:exopolyphosphatase/guanosine-5'-triphosphate,3'-diphosphate pyrophosphatase